MNRTCLSADRLQKDEVSDASTLLSTGSTEDEQNYYRQQLQTTNYKPQTDPIPPSSSYNFHSLFPMPVW